MNDLSLQVYNALLLMFKSVYGLFTGLKTRFPDRVHLLRGNHESRQITQVRTRVYNPQPFHLLPMLPISSQLRPYFHLYHHLYYYVHLHLYLFYYYRNIFLIIILPPLSPLYLLTISSLLPLSLSLFALILCTIFHAILLI